MPGYGASPVLFILILMSCKGRSREFAFCLSVVFSEYYNILNISLVFSQNQSAPNEKSFG